MLVQTIKCAQPEVVAPIREQSLKPSEAEDEQLEGQRKMDGVRPTKEVRLYALIPNKVPTTCT